MSGNDGLLTDYIADCLDEFEDDCEGRGDVYPLNHAPEFIDEYVERFANTLRTAVMERAYLIRWRRQQEEG